MTEDKSIILQVQLKNREIEIFESAFKASGFRAQAEYVRYLIHQDFKLLGVK